MTAVVAWLAAIACTVGGLICVAAGSWAWIVWSLSAAVWVWIALEAHQ